MNVDNIQYPAPKQEYKVLVRCATYNQSKYIEDALNGFVLQQTNFPFVCLVMDDASTDGEQDVIKEWMERECDMSRAETIDIPTSVVIIVPHKTNESCTFAFYLLKQNLYKVQKEKVRHVTPWREKCEYEALCEGDDYWIDPLKLQKQVDILDSRDDVSMVYTAFSTVDENGSPMYREYFAKCIECSRSGKLLPLLLDKNFIMTLTVMYREKLYNNQRFDDYKGARLDYFLFMQMASQGEIAYIGDVTGCYRNNPNGAIATRKKKVDSALWEIYKYFSIKLIEGEIGEQYNFYEKAKMIIQCYFRALKSYVKGRDREYVKILLNTQARVWNRKI